MGTIDDIILAYVTLALAIFSVLAGLIYSAIAIEYDCKRRFKLLEIGDQYLIVSRRNPRLYVYLTITDLDTNKGTVSYNLRNTKSDTNYYGEKTVGYRGFFLSSILSNNATYVEYLGNVTLH